MHYRLVLNNRLEHDIPNSVLNGQLRQDLKYFKFRRVPSKTGNSLFYLFFRKEEDTYYALRIAKSMRNISLVRYRHRESAVPPLQRPDDILISEMQYRPVPSQDMVDLIRHNYTNYLDKFVTKNLFKEFVQRVSEQIIIQRMRKQEVRERICKLNHWWWLNNKRIIANSYDIQKLLDIFFT